jgi:AcrR family transcriptional regulator
MKRAIREEARRLRQEGISVREIAQRLSVSKGSISVWVRDIELTAAQIALLKEKQRSYAAQYNGGRRNRQKFLEFRRMYQEQGRATAREMRPLHLTGCMLCWAEGAKDPNSMYFTNSDPNMLGLYLRFLRQEMNLEEAAITVRIHCHTNDPHEIRRIEQYWLSLLNLPDTAIRKTLFKQGSEKSKHVLPNGVCSIRVHRVQLVQHIYGAIQEYGGFENPEWLF